MALPTRHLRDCLGGDRIIEVTLPRALAAADIEALSSDHALTFLRDLPKPFFRADLRGGYSMSGIVSERTIQVTVRLARRGEAEVLAQDAARRLLGA